MKKKLIFPIIGLMIILFATSCGESDSTSPVSPGSGSSNGKGGSMARFTLSGDRLFVLNGNNLHTFNLLGGNVSEESNQLVGVGVETIFAYKDYVFIGSTNGMYIYDQSTPQPKRKSVYTHIVSCDPVIADSTFAYVTLRTGSSRCNRGSNELQVIDIKDVRTPVLLKQYAMEKPMGLGKSGGLLYLCDAGNLKIMDVVAPDVLSLKYSYPMLAPYDVIPMANHVIVSAQDGISQLRYNGTGVTYLSHIPVVK